jgi:hypothetical protein
MKPISLDDMRERVGLAIFGADWLGEVSDEDWTLIKGPNGIKQSDRYTPDGICKFPAINPCPRALAPKLDRAIGRAARCEAQYSAVDTWMMNSSIGVATSMDRKTFNAIMRNEFGPAPATAAPGQRGPKAKVLPRLMSEIESDLTSGKLTIDELRNTVVKKLAPRYNAKPSSFRAARMRYLGSHDAAQKVIPKTLRKNK